MLPRLAPSQSRSELVSGHTACEDVVRDYHVGAPASAPDERVPCLFKWCASHPEKHRRDSQQEIHGYQSKPDKDPGLAVDAVRYHQQRDAERRFAPRRRADA